MFSNINPYAYRYIVRSDFHKQEGCYHSVATPSLGVATRL